MVVTIWNGKEFEFDWLESEKQLREMSNNELRDFRKDVINEREGCGDMSDWGLVLDEVEALIDNEIARRNKVIYTKEVALTITDIFEDILEKYDISIPDEERTGDNGEARLYGINFDETLTKVECTVIELLEKCEIDYKADTWNEGEWN